MNNNLNVLKLFVDNKDKSFTIKHAAATLNINYRIAYEEIMKLEAEKLINIIKYGNANVCRFNYKYSSKIIEIEEVRKNELFKNKDIKLIYKRIREIKNSFYCLILFGSYANKKNKKSSDIDICLVTDNEQIHKQVSSLIEITPLNIHLQEFNTIQFISMLKSKEFNVGNEIIKNNIVLHGIENFYEMVNNVTQ
ncbi:MAG: hypothetical protein A2729_00025 [Candidatus Buchananbacteria bacterium RIFCSPHIGHO2_01_FULL_39_14]|uniref:Polymerase beta nucleotidyltransferase domain-containing protein n=1 Tax=Candidatus Buchananbacteria bacterium RIFCSPHIGHO2_01_FULL_39_14 TaxID=1797532 RepID=A0A1G1XVU9_9BACT|nr:MAG: hypothetical protein A2729_00025 [Candidatus Buchananbacteria bacterium RIFCSPHIGHO2_01_FULL_39_14]